MTGPRLNRTDTAAATLHEPTVVHTALGRVRGIADRGVQAFLGIRYAVPPVGARRFRPPEPVQPWDGTLEATRFAPAPIQPLDPAVGIARQDMDEDCLALNIWTPEGAGPHPVLVWIHGGSQTVGGTRRPEYDGAGFAQRGVVCVTVGYRLGVFGFLELGELMGESYRGSGNNALRDLVLALEWVQQHIRAFGGDPSRVTLGGESAGAKNAATLLGVPRAQGLFHRLVAASGGAHTLHTSREAQDVAQSVRHEIGLAVSDPHRLVALPAGELLAAQEAVARRWCAKFPFRPVADGEFLPGPVLDRIADGRSDAVPALIGTSQEECAAFMDLARPPGRPASGELAHMAPADFAAMEDRYMQALEPMPAMERRIRTLTAEEYWIPSVRLAERIAQQSLAVWTYRFDLRVEGHAGGRAAHVADLPFWWSTLQSPGVECDGAAPALMSLMHRALIAFVRGDSLQSVVPGQPWPTYTPSRRFTMCWNASPRVVVDPNSAERVLWDGLLS